MCTVIKQGFGKTFTEAWDKAGTPANIKAGFRDTDIHPFKTSIIPDEIFVPCHITQYEDAQVSKVVAVIKTPAPILLSQKKTRKVSSVPGTSGTVAPNKRNPDMLFSSQEDDADQKMNAIITPSQETPEHSQALTPDSFQSFM